MSDDIKKICVALGGIIREVRKERGLSLQKAADELFKMKAPRLKVYELGNPDNIPDAGFTLDLLIGVAKVIKKTPDELFALVCRKAGLAKGKEEILALALADSAAPLAEDIKKFLSSKSRSKEISESLKDAYLISLVPKKQRDKFRLSLAQEALSKLNKKSSPFAREICEKRIKAAYKELLDNS